MRNYLRQCWPLFIYAGVFGIFINLLLLTVPLVLKLLILISRS